MFDKKEYFKAQQLAKASAELSSAVEKYLQSQLPEGLDSPSQGSSSSVKWTHLILRAQLALVLVAAVVTVAVAVLLIVQLVGSTEALLVAEARRQTTLAAQQLQQQLMERLRLDSDSPLALPAASRQLSLRAISETVLAGFPAVEGEGIGWSGKGKFPEQ